MSRCFEKFHAVTSRQQARLRRGNWEIVTSATRHGQVSDIADNSTGTSRVCRGLERWTLNLMNTFAAKSWMFVADVTGKSAWLNFGLFILGLVDSHSSRCVVWCYNRASDNAARLSGTMDRRFRHEMMTSASPELTSSALSSCTCRHIFIGFRLRTTMTSPSDHTSTVSSGVASMEKMEHLPPPPPAVADPEFA